MTVFLVIGGLGVLLVLVAVVVGDHVGGALDSLGAGDFLSGGALAGFVGAFGFGGAIALALSGSLPVAIVAGILVGSLAGALVGITTNRLQGGADHSTVRSAALVGLIGTVVSDIPADGYGEISVVAAGQPLKLNARCLEALPRGSGVMVDAVLSPTSVAVVPYLH